VANAPSIEARVPRQKPQRGASGRLHRNPDGDWVWSSDSDDESDEEDSSHPASTEPRNPSPVAPVQQPAPVEVNQRTLNIVLRMRNRRKELNDIRFEYKPTVDTADGIAQELLSTELICDEDVGPMSANLQRIVNNPPPNRVITFRVKTGFEEPNDVLDEPNLTGFAQLSLTD